MMRHLLTVFIVSILLCLQSGKSSRLLLLHHDDDHNPHALKDGGTFANSLSKGPVPPSGPSGCTNIPGSGGGGCPINEMHFAGGGGGGGAQQPHRGGGSPAYPHSVASFGVATEQK